MATFPRLKTDAIAQYPVTRRLEYRNQIVRFVDGAEQRYRDSAGPLRKWEIQLDQLDESEMAALAAFFAENQGSFGAFTFIDPKDGTAVANCSLENDDFELAALGEMRGAAYLIVVENR